MKIVIAGAGEVGTHLAAMLTKDQQDVTIIDTDSDKLQSVDSNYDILTVSGSATTYSSLNEAGVANANLFLAVTQSEEINFVAAILAKKLGANNTVVRIDNREHLLPENQKSYVELGIDMVFCPEKIAANEIINLIKQTAISESYKFADGKLSIQVFSLEKDAPIIDKNLSEIVQDNERLDFRAVAITRNGKTIIPKGNDKFKYRDLVYVITNKEANCELLKYTGKKEIEIKNIMIVGGSRIGWKTAKALEKEFNIKIIEPDKDICYKMADSLDRSLIINSDINNVHLLEEEGLRNMDAFIAVSDNSESNILSCLYAKKFGIKRTIAEIENIDYIDLAENIGIDTIINKKLIAASDIFRYTMRSRVNSLRCLIGANADVFELVAEEGAKITKKPLDKIDFPEGAIIGGVLRNNDSFIAKGNTIIKPNDRVVVFSLPSAIRKVDRLFK